MLFIWPQIWEFSHLSWIQDLTAKQTLLGHKIVCMQVLSTALKSLSLPVQGLL